ncbi:DUF4128 domain-containing protein [Alcaligenes sp. DN25]|uniref:phage tail terminator-like protein n=1 Tax=Alcaligenes TaxID=507 RepID=UPI0002AA98FF|nr:MULTISPECIES: phage tail terminator-like protein [Alcaligenes]EKU29568.1 hypothetical protein C660_13659 [Alcaligenes sp. HPC1271]ERI34900.1 hypothetical protein N879_05105 [Alcaligenes sp. EGD-AK7]URW84204.1 DUF4128 domain-containing protein [Alcaligenes sp. DN25]WEA69044.1 phage tail terminator-like protein [Alcaligenes faecalis]HRO20684.1 phage tail terminator-like protein [Alcaligenes phenolicus]
MNFEQISKAIIDHMVALTGIAQERIEYPNAHAAFTPPDTGVWCRLLIKNTDSEISGMGAKPYTRKSGEILIECFDRLGQGRQELDRLSDALDEHFSFWSEGALECLGLSQVDVAADDPQKRPQREEFYQINLTVPFRAG